jgi:threonine synthase
MERINYYNLNDPGRKVSLKSAVLTGIAGNSGLYMPDRVPVLSQDIILRLPDLSLQEIAYEISSHYLGGWLPDEAIKTIVRRSMNFPIPLVELDKNLFVLELFHGPTLAFKDVGARFMAALFEYLLKGEKRETTILVATSGDTGSAVASAFYKCSGIKVVILFPSGRVSAIQEKMLTSMGDNITALEVDGDFDDCQRLVKEAFKDRDINLALNLTSANSINLARLIPQTFYYFHAVAQLKRRTDKITLSVPSGNFGNLTAGILAWKMGLNIDTFIAASNENHPVPDYLATGKYTPRPARHTISTAMDVGDPSNFPRILSLFSNRHHEISSLIKGSWFSDIETIDAMKELQDKYGYQSDPHGAVAYLGLKKLTTDKNTVRIFLETAHPAKFRSEVEAATGNKVLIPDHLNDLMHSNCRSVKIKASFEQLKNFLIFS